MATISIKKMTLIAFSLLTFAATTAFAGETDTKLKKLQRQMNQTRAENAQGTAGAKTASRRAKVKDPYNFNVKVDVLYWSPEIENNTVTQSNSFPATGTSSAVFLPNQGEVNDLKYRWNWGVRVGVGYECTHDDWDVGLGYTYFSSRANYDKGSGQNSYYTLSRGSNAVLPSNTRYAFATEVDAEATFEFQALDLSLGRDYFVSAQLGFKPHMGLKSVWIKDTETVEYGGGNVIAPNGKQGFFGNNTKVMDKCKSWGIGPTFGINSSWHLYRGFSLMGDVSSSLIYTSFKTRHNNTFSGSAETDVINVTNNYHMFIPVIDFFIGLKWETFFNKCNNHFDIDLGWETQVWWDQIQRFEDSLGAGHTTNVSGVYTGRDLSMQGMTLRFKVMF